MQLLSIRLKNFKAFKEIEIKNMPRFCTFVGANGVGKSTLFSVFSFLGDAFASNVRDALKKLGGAQGFREVRTRGAEGAIVIELKFRAEPTSPIATYHLEIDEVAGRPVVAKEVLQYKRGGWGRPWKFLDFENGKGYAIANEKELLIKGAKVDALRTRQSVKSPDILALKGLSQYEDFPVAAALGNLIESWNISDIRIDHARKEQDISVSEKLTRTGDNLAWVLNEYRDNHPETFRTIIEEMQKCIPGISTVSPCLTEEGKVLLKIGDAAFTTPFIGRHVSDGTIKMLAYLALLHAPEVSPLLCVEEPENQLYVDLLEPLAEQFRGYALRGGQVFVSTHSPDFLNALRPEEVFVIKKENGTSSVRCLGEDEQIQALVAEGERMGYLWKMNYFD